jgi:hypothetical protein
MTALMRNPLVWHGAAGILLILGFVFGGSVLARHGPSWPLSPGYVAWRMLAGRIAAPCRRAAAGTRSHAAQDTAHRRHGRGAESGRDGRSR